MALCSSAPESVATGRAAPVNSRASTTGSSTVVADSDRVIADTSTAERPGSLAPPVVVCG